LRPVPTKSDLIGTWSHPHSSSQLQIEADGEFVLNGIPRGVITESPTNGVGATIEPAIEGRWEIGEYGTKRDANGGPFVELLFTSPSVVAHRIGMTLDYEVSDQKPKLYVYLGDPDNAKFYTWTKTD
jgi:hypothetical protein